MKKLLKKVAAWFGGAVGVSVVAVPVASAAVPEAVTSALETLQSDGVAMATTVLVAIIAIFAIKFLRRGI